MVKAQLRSILLKGQIRDVVVVQIETLPFSQFGHDAALAELIWSAVYLQQFTAFEEDLACFNLLINVLQCHSYVIDETELENPTLYNQSMLKPNLPVILMGAKRYREALNFLPEVVTVEFLDFLIADAEFCSLLTRENPEWIKRQSLGRLNIAFLNLDLTMAKFSVDHVDGLIAHVNYPNVSRHIFLNCSLELIEQMVYGFSDGVVLLNFLLFCDLQMDTIRFVKILRFFLDRCTEIFNSVTFTELELKAEKFIAVLEEGGAEMVSILKQQHFGVKFVLSNDSFFTILHSDQLRTKLLKHKELFKQLVGLEQLQKFLIKCSSPAEIYYGSLLSNDGNHANFVKSLIVDVWKPELVNELKHRDLMYKLMGLSRAWHSALKKTILGPEYDKISLFQNLFNPHLAGSIASLYSFYSRKGKAIFNSVIAELYRPIAPVKDQINVEP